MSQWFYAHSGQRNGPMSRADLDARIADGEVRGDSLVWRPGMAAWSRADAVAELGVPPPLAEVRAEVPEAVEAAVPPRIRTWVPTYAGFWARLAAKLVDGLLLASVGNGVEWAVTRWILHGPVPMPPDWPGFFHAIAWLVSLNTAVALVYGVYFQLRHEATPGKRLLGLRVVRADGRRLGGWRAFARYWAEQLSGLTFLAGYVMAAFDDQKRTLHDLCCDTRVVHGERRPDDPE